MKIQLAYVVIALFFTLPVDSMAKTDIVIFDNGDRLTGEVKSLERGRLRFKTDATDTISIEWDDVAYLSSDQNIQVETDEGIRYLGHLSRAETVERIVVETPGGTVDLDANTVVLMTPIEERGINRLDGDITAGLNFAKASQIQQLHFGLDMDYRTETRIISLNANVTQSDSADNESSQRQSLNLNYRRLLRDRWLIGGGLLLDRNDELGIDLRTSLAMGVGRFVKQSNSTTLHIEGGLQLSRENTTSGTLTEDTLEAFTSLHWDWFRYDSPELDLATNLKLIPSLTQSGRIRSEFDISLKWEIVDDLFWELSLYDSYDSKPVVSGSEKNDYGINTSLGYDF